MDFMDDVRRAFDNPDVVMTIGSIRRALFTFHPPSVVDHQLSSHMALLHEVFDEEPEILLHDDPAKWAELLAWRWGWVSQDELRQSLGAWVPPATPVGIEPERKVIVPPASEVHPDFMRVGDAIQQRHWDVMKRLADR